MPDALLLADDHRLLREALEQILQPRYDVVGAVADGRAWVAAARELHPDVVVLVIAGPLGDRLERRSTAQACLMPAVKVIFLTVSEDPDLAAEALSRIGASACSCSKTPPPWSYSKRFRKHLKDVCILHP